MENESADNTEIVFSILILMLIYFFWVWPFTSFGQAVNQSNNRAGEPLDFPMLAKYAPGGVEDYLFFPLTSTIVVFFLLWGLRAVLPGRYKHKLVLIGSDDDQGMSPVNNAKPAVWSALLSITGIIVLIFAAFHIRSDRTHRQPVITWEGPAADYFEWLLVLGWTLSYLGVVGGMIAQQIFSSRWNWLSLIGIAGGCTFPISFIVYCGLYED